MFYQIKTQLFYFFFEKNIGFSIFAPENDRILYTMDLRVKEICKAKGILFKDLAALVGVHEVTLRSSLTGNPTIGTLQKVADALGVEFLELFAPKRADFTAFIDYRGDLHRFDNIEALRGYLSTIEAE